MKANFSDIVSRIAEKPSFYQEDGVPRYGRFTPDMSPCVHASEIALMEIACQVCDTRFNVAIYNPIMQNGEILANSIKDGSIHYKDPPNTGCCSAGATMNSWPIRIIEYWRRYDPTLKGELSWYNWDRNPKLEGFINSTVMGVHAVAAHGPFIGEEN